MSSDPMSAPPAGWYPDPTGQVRWWDGKGWTAETQGGPGGRPNASMAMFANLGGVVGGFLVPLVIYLVDGGKDRFVRHNAAEALNFQITSIVFTIVVYIPAFAILFASIPASGSRSGGGMVGGALAFFIFSMVLVIAERILNLVWSIMGMVRANRLQYWRYPLRINFVKGSLTPEELDITP